MILTEEFKTEQELMTFAGELAKVVKPKALIFLSGPLGAGKTTFVRGFMHGLGYIGKIKSPTYTLVEPYTVQDKDVFHFDLYRVKRAGELEFLGIDEYLSKNAICIIEWAEKGFPLLPQPDIACYIEVKGEGRGVRLEALSTIGEGILERISS